MDIVEAIGERSNKFNEFCNMMPDTLILGLDQDRALVNYINASGMNTCDGDVSTAHNAEFRGMKIRVIDREEDLLEVSVTRWRDL